MTEIQQSEDSLIATAQSVLLNNYGRLPLVMQRGSGSELYSTEGKRYIDLFAGFGAGGLLGHCHPRVSAALQQQAETLLSHGNLFSSEPQIQLASRLAAELPGAQSFFCNSGAEAAEAALKLARKAHPNRHKIICFENCFHGRTMGALSLCPESFQQGFEPMLEGAIRLAYNDISALEAHMSDEIAGVFIEPIQGEGGIVVPSMEFMQRLRALCDQHGALLICDEVWTAPARTGAFFAYQHFGITPDAVTLAKALGGGIPLAACLISERYVDILGPGSHGCTLGGNPLCAAAGVAALAVVDEENLTARADTLGELGVDLIADAKLGLVRSVRGKGCMWGIELASSVQAFEVMKACLSRGVSIGAAKQNVIRFAPALTIEEPLLREGLALVIDVLRELEREN